MAVMQQAYAHLGQHQLRNKHKDSSGDGHSRCQGGNCSADQVGKAGKLEWQWLTHDGLQGVKEGTAQQVMCA
jgi:hypothetical protein